MAVALAVKQDDESARVARLFLREKTERARDAARAVKGEAVMPDRPARLQPGHQRDRFLGKHAGAKRAWTNTAEHPLRLAFERGKLEQELYLAGDLYREKCEQTARSGRDSTQFSVFAAGGERAPWTQDQFSAMRWLERVEGQLKEADRVIVRRFCGEGWSMIEAVRFSGVPCHPDGVRERVREALIELVRALKRKRA